MTLRLTFRIEGLMVNCYVAGPDDPVLIGSLPARMRELDAELWADWRKLMSRCFEALWQLAVEVCGDDVPEEDAA